METLRRWYAEPVLQGRAQETTCQLLWQPCLLFLLPLLPTLLNRLAPYGKFSPPVDRRFTLHSSISWCIQESPSFFIPAAFLLQTSASFERCVLLAAFAAHYFQRSFIYGLSIKASSSRTLPIVTFSALLFTSVNGLLQTFSALACHEPGQLLYPALLLMAAGETINIRSDRVLVRLKATCERYEVPPNVGLFRYVSCANYFGELLAVWGYALAAQSPSGWCHAAFSTAMLLHRGYHTHRFYIRKFENYPKSRHAIIPFLF